MSFTFLEKEAMRDILYMDYKDETELKQIIPADDFNWLESRNFIRTIKDRIVITGEKSSRRWENCIITKFISSKNTCFDVLDKLINAMTGNTYKLLYYS